MTNPLPWGQFSGGPKITDGVHIIPMNDVMSHDYTPDCWCKPLQDGYQFIHTSADRREDYEDGLRKVN